MLTSLPAAPPPARAAQAQAPAERIRLLEPATGGGQHVVPQGIIIPAFRVNAATAESPVNTLDETSVVYGFTGRITVIGKGSVKYRWVRSDGGKGPVKELAFGATTMQFVEATHWKRDGAPGTTHAGWMNVEILYPNPLYPPAEGVPSTVYVKPEKCRYTMTCQSSSTPQRVQLTGWSSPPTVVWVAAGSGTYPGYPEIDWEAGVNIKNISTGAIDSSRVIICSYSAVKSESWGRQPPPLPNQMRVLGSSVQECFQGEATYSCWWMKGQGGVPDLGLQQTTSLHHKRRITTVGTGSSSKAIVYVRAQVHDREKEVVTTSNWLRWELPGGGH